MPAAGAWAGGLAAAGVAVDAGGGATLADDDWAGETEAAGEDTGAQATTISEQSAATRPTSLRLMLRLIQ